MSEPRPQGIAAASRPTRARHWVVVFAVSLAVIAYIDRVCVSQAAAAISDDLGLTSVQMGYAFAAFAWAYGLFEIPGGWLGDWHGPRRVLTLVVVWWSFFIAATGWAWNHLSLMIGRFGFGAGAAGCFPNLTKAFIGWLPGEERVRAQGIMWLSARWGGAFTPLLVVWMLEFVSWRRMFELLGILGIVWAVFFWRWFRDNPREHRGVNAAELARLPSAGRASGGRGAVPWARFLRSRTVWLLLAQYFCLGYGWYFYITWLPTYLRDARGVSLQTGAFLSAFPLFFGGLACFACGMALSRLGRWTGGAGRARRLVACVGFAGAGGLLLLSLRSGHPVGAMVAMGLASFANDLVMPPAWAAVMDVGGKYAGTLSGAMNMMGNLAGGVAPIMVGYILRWTEQNWAVAFYVSAAVYLLGMICWMFIDPVTPLDDENSLGRPAAEQD